MDVVYIILIGVGFVIMLLSLFFKQKGSSETNTELLTQRTTDKAELERGLQRFGKQIKHQHEVASAELQQTRSDLLQEMTQLRMRIEELERLGVATRAKSAATVSEESKTEPKEPAEVDMLALKERYRRVFELEKEGLSPDEIAKRLGAGRGEIDLIFMLAAKHERGQAHA
jgi:DNA-directed RNA polymerase specialized sigma24 family protein